MNLNKEAPRWICGSGESEESFNININDIGRTEKLPLKAYWERPTELEDFSLYRLQLTHKLVKNKWNKSPQKNIVRIYPRPSPLCEGPQWEEYCRIKVLLHVHHRNLQQLTENDTIEWSTLYSRYIEKINFDPADLLGPPLDHEESEIIDNDEELIEDNEDEEF